jgi:hypothetical protein
VKYVLLFVDTEQFNNELRAMGPAERDRAAVSRSLTGPSRASQVQPRPTTYSHNGRETRQPYQPRQRPIAAALPAPQHQDQAREPRLRVYVDRREIDRLHLSAAAAIDVQPAIACFECRADRRRPVVRRCSVPALDDRRATLPLGSARPGRGLQPRQMPASPVRCCRPWLISYAADRQPTAYCTRSPRPARRLPAGSGPECTGAAIRQPGFEFGVFEMILKSKIQVC